MEYEQNYLRNNPSLGPLRDLDKSEYLVIIRDNYQIIKYSLLSRELWPLDTIYDTKYDKIHVHLQCH